MRLLKLKVASEIPIFNQCLRLHTLAKAVLRIMIYKSRKSIVHSEHVEIFTLHLADLWTFQNGFQIIFTLQNDLFLENLTKPKFYNELWDALSFHISFSQLPWNLFIEKKPIISQILIFIEYIRQCETYAIAGNATEVHCTPRSHSKGEQEFDNDRGITFFIVILGIYWNFFKNFNWLNHSKK